MVFLYFVHFQLLKVCAVPILRPPHVLWFGPAPMLAQPEILTPLTGESALQPKISILHLIKIPGISQKLTVLSWFLMF